RVGAGSEATVTYGASLLAVYSAGLGIPFLIAAAAMKPFLAFMGRFRSHLKAVERVIGGLLVITGVLFMTGSMNDIAFWILETFPNLPLG
ncbi:MAG: cytochrome c biogenesis protein CcdA, partial [Proteobacteria bacterium]|nr:cytochrome c biogenesis protein CcdA [Pseudomonadota bacterium]